LSYVNRALPQLPAQIATARLQLLPTHLKAKLVMDTAKCFGADSVAADSAAAKF
jgi:hypothetical protein